jgi:phosphatidylserine decarboxylase
MNTPIKVFDLFSKKIFDEQIPAESLLRFLYEANSFTAFGVKMIFAKFPLISKLVGFWMKMPWTKRNILPFVNKYGVNLEDFEEKNYENFNDFFIRKLKTGARKISSESIICPCDGRHFFYKDLSEKNSFYVKGKNFSLETLLKDKNLAAKYLDGSMIISRLAPVDYHRFHFPVDGKIEEIKPINGFLYSVNPLALRTNPSLITENKRTLIKINSTNCATNVGSIHLSAKTLKNYKKGDELGFFSFGGSMVITLFEKDTVNFSEKLTKLTKENVEVFMQFGSGFFSI